MADSEKGSAENTAGWGDDMNTPSWGGGIMGEHATWRELDKERGSGHGNLPFLNCAEGAQMMGRGRKNRTGHLLKGMAISEPP